MVTSLGHVGIICDDFLKMRDFYTRVIGLTVTDEDPERGSCFLSADPKNEHHELNLVLSQLGFGNCLRKRLRLPPFFRSVDVGGWQPWDENGMWSGWKGKKETSWND